MQCKKDNMMYVNLKIEYIKKNKKISSYTKIDKIFLHELM